MRLKRSNLKRKVHKNGVAQPWQPRKRHKGKLLDDIYSTPARARSNCMKRDTEHDMKLSQLRRWPFICLGSFIIVLQGTPHGSLVSRVSRRQDDGIADSVLGEIGHKERDWRIMSVDCRVFEA